MSLTEDVAYMMLAHLFASNEDWLSQEEMDFLESQEEEAYFWKYSTKYQYSHCLEFWGGIDSEPSTSFDFCCDQHHNHNSIYSGSCYSLRWLLADVYSEKSERLQELYKIALL
jgi:hypothetical protein